MVPDETIREAVRLLVEAAHPARIVLFGSYARGTAESQSDVDLLVVERELKSRHGEMVRLRRVLSPLRIPVDVLVTSEAVYNEWRDTPGTVLCEAAREGTVLYDEAA